MIQVLKEALIHEDAIRMIIIRREKELIRMNAFLDLNSAFGVFMTLMKTAMNAMLSTSSRTDTGNENGINMTARTHNSKDEPVIQSCTSLFI